MNHVRALLTRVRDGHSAESHPDGIFLGADDREFFQELVGFRLAGMRSAVLAALRFQKHGLPGIQFARESLAGYLARPPAAPQSGPFAAAAGRIVALMPRAQEPIPGFLKGLRAGRDTPSMVLDPRQISVAFDFRAHNPSAQETDKQRAGLICPPKTRPSPVLESGRGQDTKGEGTMAAPKRLSPAQIINRLRKAEVALANGNTTKEVCRELGVSEQTYYRWRREYGGMKLSQAKRLKEFEKENQQLKRAVAELTLDKLILKEASEGNF